MPYRITILSFFILVLSGISTSAFAEDEEEDLPAPPLFAAGVITTSTSMGSMTLAAAIGAGIYTTVQNNKSAPPTTGLAFFAAK